MQKLTDAELTRARQNFADAKASLACEGIVLTAEEEALFQSFEEERLPFDECRRRAVEFSRQKRALKVRAAE